MAVPTVVTDLSATIASNSPAGSDSPATLDDFQRAHAAFIRQIYDYVVATFTFPGGTSTPPTTEGMAYWNTTTDKLTVGSGAAALEMVDKASAQTLTNKTIAASSNTLTGVATLAGSETLTNKTINSASNTLTGVATLAGAQTLTNKTLTAPIIATISNTGLLTLPTDTDTLVGRATTDTLTNKTLTAPALTTPVITGYTETAYVPSAGSAFTVDLANGTIQKLTTSGNVTITLPTPAAGKSFTLLVAYGGTHTLTWAGGGTIRWAGGAAPTATSVNGKVDTFTFWSVDATDTFASGGGMNA